MKAISRMVQSNAYAERISALIGGRRLTAAGIPAAAPGVPTAKTSKFRRRLSARNPDIRCFRPFRRFLETAPPLLRDPRTDPSSKESGMQTRRDFVRVCTMAAAAVGLSMTRAAEIVAAASKGLKPSVVWLHFQECTGCTRASPK
jgi:hypothetical protein